MRDDTLGRMLAYAPGAAVACCAALLLAAIAASAPPERKQPLDPAAWGGDHVGRPVPAFTESGECLFCHRAEVGRDWHTNKHNRTVRRPEGEEPALVALRGDPATKDFAGAVEFLLGDTRAQRFLKSSPDFGKAELLSVVAEFGRGTRARLTAKENPHWDAETFATACAGCHTTAVDPETHAFSLPYLDCFVCHGEPPAEHANDASLATLAKGRKESPALVTSICASCHIRFGKSQATGLPYPTNFVAGDNLFRDFQVDWKGADDPRLNPADRHVLDNVREVVVNGNEQMTCLSCHQVHTGSSTRHRDLPVVGYCQHCHDPGTPIKGHKIYEVHSERCRY
jgi:hypothetical protein